MDKSRINSLHSLTTLIQVRILALAILMAQVIGAVVGFVLTQFSQTLVSVWFGLAIAALPGFVAGAYLQSHLEPGALQKHRVLVYRLGGLAAIITGTALTVRWLVPRTTAGSA